MVAACSSDSEQANLSDNSEPTEVTLTFSPYDVTPITRTATSISGVVTHLDVWLQEGGNTTDVHQASTDDGFGTVNVTLDKTKTYTLYAVAHKCTSDATLADGVISFPDDKVTHSLYYSTTFSPATTTNLSCLMQRIVAQFSFQTTDTKPADVAKMRFTIGSVFDRWNVSTGATHGLDRVSTFNSVSTNNDGTVTFNLYAIVTDAQTTHTVTVEAFTSGDVLKQTRTFTDVPLRNGYKTTYRGVYFTDTPVASAFTVEDWNSYDTVAF